MIWNESIECMDRESLRKIQGIRLKKTVERVYHDTPSIAGNAGTGRYPR